MEIERKYLIKQILENRESFPCHTVEQAYLCTGPVMRVRREGDSYYPMYKGKGFLSREEYNLPLNEQAYHHLLAKADGIIFTEERYLIPVGGVGHLTVEMGIFEGSYQGPILAEVEFPTGEETIAFKTPGWPGRNITFPGEFQNNRLAYGDTNIPCKQV